MSLAGKTLRLTDAGTVPPDNPFVGRAGYRPEVYTLGHRNILGLAVHPTTGAIWSVENGPNGGDEVNELQPGRNYGWPVVSHGRFYLGPRVSVNPYKEGMEPPAVFWVPAIAASGLTFYTGDSFRSGRTTCSSAVCVRERCRGRVTWSASTSTSRGRSCIARACCGTCSSASETSVRDQTATSTC